MKLGCVVMAAGNSSRFGENKLAQHVNGKTVFRRTLESIPAESFDGVVVVLNSPLFSDIVKDLNFTYIYNVFPEKGISRTIALGLSALSECDGVLFCVADQPLLRRESICALISLWRSAPDKIAALAHQGRRGNPCLFPARFFPELLALEGDRGGSAVIRRHEEELVLLEVDSPQLQDIDTPEQFRALLDTIS